jgi:2-iminobutanoate/2-iminopropanoate deaminase
MLAIAREISQVSSLRIEHHNPPALHRNPAFTQVVTIHGADCLVFVGGQNAVDASGNIVGETLASQTEQALRNVLTALASVNASQEHVTRLGIYFVQGHDPREAYGAAQRIWGAHPTAITVLGVAALGNPSFLVEIEATAAVAT